VTDAYALAWPEGWQRTPKTDQVDGRYRFKRQVNNGRYTSGEPWTFAAARDALIEEVWKHKPSSFVFSSNFQPGRNGPSEGRRRPEDQAVAIYFRRAGKDYVMACDRYLEAEGNMRSLALALDAMRTLERHGGGVMMERAFEGFMALPAPLKPHELLGVPPDADEKTVRAAWRRKIGDAHPDQGGTGAAELNAARDDMLRRLTS